MQIDYIICPEKIEDKLESKHHVTVKEAGQVLLNEPRIGCAEKDYTFGNDIYGTFGHAFEGRYLSIFFIHKPDPKTAIKVSARDMSEKKKKSYGRK